jgi:ABC-type amino acid transport system permease subunit
VPIYLGAALAYLLVTIPSGFVFRVIENRVAIRR